MKLVNKQKGNILVMFTISLFVLIGMSALALDGGHLLLNKNRLQNVVDSAALAAAKELDSGGTHASSKAEAIAIISHIISKNDYHEFSSELTDLTNDVVVQFSERPDPFIVVTEGLNEDINRYVRVSIAGLNLENYLAELFNLDKKVSATAVAGPSTALINCYSDLVPLMVCSKPSSVSDGEYSYPDNTFYGYSLNELTVMKIGAGEDSDVGSGNFQLLNLPGDQGGNDIRVSLAGAGLPGIESCFSTSGSDSELTTAPGNKVGPALQGLNVRFNTSKLDGYKPDLNTCQGNDVELVDGILAYSDTVPNGNPSIEDVLTVFNYDADGDVILTGGKLIVSSKTDPDTGKIYDIYDYDNYEANASCPISGSGTLDTLNGVDERRIVNVIIAECDGMLNGSKPPAHVGSGCFFLNQDIEQGGQESIVVGQFLEDCTAQGIPRIDSTNNPGPYTIVLYHDPGSKDS